jgi:hypothetical protein
MKVTGCAITATTDSEQSLLDSDCDSDNGAISDTLVNNNTDNEEMETDVSNNRSRNYREQKGH